jgi:GDPmannose 4,6-dehydratase
MTSKVIITGGAGQDGLILGTKLSVLGTEVIALAKNQEQVKLILNYNPAVQSMVINSSNIIEIETLLKNIKPDFVFHLSSKSSVADSWENSEETLLTNVMHTLNWLNALRNLKMQHVHFYHASSSEMFGIPMSSPQNELTAFHPRSPYGVSKVAAHHLVVNYRESYGQFASTGILFNHESPLRPDKFVTRKITKAVTEISLGKRDHFSLGSLNVSRDWGWAPDYVDGMIKILNHSEPDDFVLATGMAHSLRDFLDIAFKYVGISEWKKFVSVDENLSRPAEVQNLVGDSSKARNLLKWAPTLDFESIVTRMVDFDLELIKSDYLALNWKCN